MLRRFILTFAILAAGLTAVALAAPDGGSDVRHPSSSCGPLPPAKLPCPGELTWHCQCLPATDQQPARWSCGCKQKSCSDLPGGTGMYTTTEKCPAGESRKVFCQDGQVTIAGVCIEPG